MPDQTPIRMIRIRQFSQTLLKRLCEEWDFWKSLDLTIRAPSETRDSYQIGFLENSDDWSWSEPWCTIRFEYLIRDLKVNQLLGSSDNTSCYETKAAPTRIIPKISGFFKMPLFVESEKITNSIYRNPMWSSIRVVTDEMTVQYPLPVIEFFLFYFSNNPGINQKELF